MLAKKQNAKSALNFEQVAFPVMPSQFQILPQCIGPMKFARRPKAIIKSAKRSKSTGQWIKEAKKGRRKSKEKRIPIAATTSV